MTRPEPVYYCALENRTLKEENTVRCIVRECYYLLLLKPEELKYLRSVYKK